MFRLDTCLVRNWFELAACFLELMEERHSRVLKWDKKYANAPLLKFRIYWKALILLSICFWWCVWRDNYDRMSGGPLDTNWIDSPETKVTKLRKKCHVNITHEDWTHCVLVKNKDRKHNRTLHQNLDIGFKSINNLLTPAYWCMRTINS